MKHPEENSLKRRKQDRMNSAYGKKAVRKIYIETLKEQKRRMRAVPKTLPSAVTGARTIEMKAREDFRSGTEEFSAPLTGKETVENKPQRDERPYYDKYDLNAVYQYIADAFGPIAWVYHDEDHPIGPRIDIAVIDPSEDRNFYTLVTIGMGNHRMRDLSGKKDPWTCFAELVIFFPEELELWRVDWPFRLLTAMARHFIYSYDAPAPIAPGLSYSGEIMQDTPFDGALFVPAPTRDDQSYQLILELERYGHIVNYYLLLPLFQDEVDDIRTHEDSNDFWIRYFKCIGTVAANPTRKSCVSDLEDDGEKEGPQ